MDLSLNNTFTEELHQQARTIQRSTGYFPSNLLKRIQYLNNDGFSTVCQLLSENEPQKELFKLHELNRLDLSIETFLISSKWNSFFSENQRQICRDRLSKLNFKLPNREKNVAIISDNLFLSSSISKLICSQKLVEEFRFSLFSSPVSPLLEANINFHVDPVRLNNDCRFLIDNYGIILSAHCKQLFPVELVHASRCANIHPGLNPYNRGWYPQVFSILNKKPWGATFHLIDTELDHGSIIAQKVLPLFAWDTSLTAYERVQKAEVLLLEQNLGNFLRNTYSATAPFGEGNVNFKADFNSLLHLDLQQSGTLGEHIDLLRALTHGDYNNAFFLDETTGRKIFVSLNLRAEDH